MKKLCFALVLVIVGESACAAGFADVIVRQQWPWREAVKVEYVITGVTEAVDIDVSLYDGETELVVPGNAVVGKRFGISEGGVGTIEIDPSFLADGGPKTMSALRVELSARPAARNDYEEVLYKIFDLTDGSCTDVTRRELLERRYGAVETSYAAVDPAFSTSLGDVVIWTGVTNNPAYRTTKLVMRKIKAKDVVWQSGDPEGTLVNQFALTDRYWVKLTYDYYIGVFETTLAQYKAMLGKYPDGCLFGANGNDDVPANKTHYYFVVGYTASDYAAFNTVVSDEKLCFPRNKYVRDVGKMSFMAKMWEKTKVEFNLPTLAEWEFACRAGTDGVLYSGEAQSLKAVKKLAWGNQNTTCIMRGGEKAPNAFGLYDMLGNAIERVMSRGAMNLGAASGGGLSKDDPAVDPLGQTDTTATTVGVSCGGGYMYANGHWEDCRASGKTGWYEYGGTNEALGFRVVIPATDNGQWAAHPVE